MVSPAYFFQMLIEDYILQNIDTTFILISPTNSKYCKLYNYKNVYKSKLIEYYLKDKDNTNDDYYISLILSDLENKNYILLVIMHDIYSEKPIKKHYIDKTYALVQKIIGKVNCIIFTEHRIINYLI